MTTPKEPVQLTDKGEALIKASEQARQHLPKLKKALITSNEKVIAAIEEQQKLEKNIQSKQEIKAKQDVKETVTAAVSSRNTSNTGGGK